jgi:hypothetical protein
MDSLDMVSISVENKFMKLSYKRKKVTLKDISLIKQQNLKETLKEFIAWKLIAKTANTSNE